MQMQGIPQRSPPVAVGSASWDAAMHYRGAQAWGQPACPSVNAWLGDTRTHSQLNSIACKDPGSDCYISSPISP